MLKIRTWIKLGAGLIVPLFMWFLTILFWPKAAPSAETIVKRGLVAPARRSSVWKGPFDIAQDRIDQGLDGLAEWEQNPLGIQKTYFSQDLMDLKNSKDPKDQAEYRRLIELPKL